MAEREFQSLRSLLPGLLCRVARGGGSSRGLQPVWVEVAGNLIAKHARPVAWHGELLVLDVKEARWLKEFLVQEPELLTKFAALLGEDAPKKLSFRLRA